MDTRGHGLTEARRCGHGEECGSDSTSGDVSLQLQPRLDGVGRGMDCPGRAGGEVDLVGGKPAPHCRQVRANDYPTWYRASSSHLPAVLEEMAGHRAALTAGRAGNDDGSSVGGGHAAALQVRLRCGRRRLPGLLTDSSQSSRDGAHRLLVAANLSVEALQARLSCRAKQAAHELAGSWPKACRKQVQGKLEHSLDERTDEPDQPLENGLKPDCAHALLCEIDTALYDALSFLQQPA